MIPLQSLTPRPVITAYLPPDDMVITELSDWELGGVSLSDGSKGLQVQFWNAYVVGSGPSTAVWVTAPTVPPTFLFARSGIIWIRLAFDQNMKPVVCFVDDTGPNFWWWDPTIPGVTFTALASDVIHPCCTMDDKRALQVSLGNNDVIITYMRSSSLYYRQQRDRYGVEYLLASGLGIQMQNLKLWTIGMDKRYRLLWLFHGGLYQ